MTILLGVPEDPPLAAIYAALLARNAPCLLVDQQEIERFTVELRVGKEFHGVLYHDGNALDFRDANSIFIRPYQLREETMESAPPTWSVEQALLLWADAAAPLAVNRPAAMASNGSKPYQLTLIQKCGFRVPETILSTDPEFVRDFWRRHERVIYKSISGVRSIVSQLTDERGAALDDLAWCPTQFQRYIAGEEYRVHVVGTRVFPCRIISDADDYRYSPEAVFAACAIPDEIAERCVALSRGLGLIVAGIDLRHTPDGEWVCFEVNPSPGFSCFERKDHGEIAAAIAALLADPAESSELAGALDVEAPRRL